MTDCQQQRSGMKLTNVKQELSNAAEENEHSYLMSIPSNHLSSQTAFEQEEESSTTSQAEEDAVHLNKMSSLTCQVKTEPQSEGEEDGFDLQSMAEDYPTGYVIKREIIEVHAEDHLMMDDDENHSNTTTNEDCGTEANCTVKSENDNWSPNFFNNNIEEQKSIMLGLTREMNNEQICTRIGSKKEISYTPAKTLSQTKKSRTCCVCAKVFRSSQAYLQHMWNTHTGADLFTCEVCGKGCKHKSNLHKHKAIHSDERPFSCDVCNKAFKLKHVLQDHKVACHSDERPYSCDLCNSAFKRKNILRIHKVTCHSDERPFSCDVCNKAFKQKWILHRHKVMCHSNERPYSCDVCKKTYKLKGHLRKHKKAFHSNERPYS